MKRYRHTGSAESSDLLLSSVSNLQDAFGGPRKHVDARPLVHPHRANGEVLRREPVPKISSFRWKLDSQDGSGRCLEGPVHLREKTRGPAATCDNGQVHQMARRVGRIHNRLAVLLADVDDPACLRMKHELDSGSPCQVLRPSATPVGHREACRHVQHGLVETLPLQPVERVKVLRQSQPLCSLKIYDRSVRLAGGFSLFPLKEKSKSEWLSLYD